jgi:selenocysteine lyase/cysteine desulfurase
MMPYMVEQFGNPHSRTHLYGWQSEEAVERARKQVADLIGADAKEIIFTSVCDTKTAKRLLRRGTLPTGEPSDVRVVVGPVWLVHCDRGPRRATTWPSRASRTFTRTRSGT